MKDLKKYLFESEGNNSFILEYCNVIAEDTIINESFKLPILKKLASKIYLWETEHRETYKREMEKYKNGDREYKPTNDETSFSKIFGPYIVNKRYGKGTKVRGCQWDKLDDSNVEFYEGGWDSKLHKKLKKLWNCSIKGIVIACDPDTHDIEYVVRGFNYSEDGKKIKPITWYFQNALYKNGEPARHMVQQYGKQKGNRYRACPDFTLEEFIETINDYEIYFIEIPDSMVNEYNDLLKTRRELQDGIINYDKESLEQLARTQRANYKQLAKELRAKRLAENPKYLYDDLEKLNGEVLDMYKQVSETPELIDKWYGIGDLMSYTSNAFNEYFDYVRYMDNAKKSEEYARQQGDENPERHGDYYREYGASKLEDCRKRISDVRKKIDDFKKLLNN